MDALRSDPIFIGVVECRHREKAIMGNSLQDQLLKAGLVSEQRAKQTRSAKRKSAKQAGGKDRTPEESRLRARQAAAEKANRDRELNLKREEEARRKAEENELRQLIHGHRLSRRDGDLPYNFQDGANLKRIYVTAEQKAGLAAGRIALVRQDTGYEAIPAEIAERVLARRPELVLVLNAPGREEPEGDDEYAQYKIPDDLMW
jgi:uncharacterized protein YaiL (DUF2058 family)